MDLPTLQRDAASEAYGSVGYWHDEGLNAPLDTGFCVLFNKYCQQTSASRRGGVG